MALTPITQYRERVLANIEQTLAPLGPITTALDFGSGDGYFCSRLRASGRFGAITPVDVVERAHSLVPPLLYDGGALPFGDASFDLTYAVDVLHHCPDPSFALDEMARCTKRWLLLKDHNCNGVVGDFALAVLDELGNRRFGIPSPGLYQRRWSWMKHLQARGFQRVAFVHPMKCHVGLLGALTNSLQFMALWQRA